jgi:hypothetical protein
MEEEKKFSGQREQGGPYISREWPEFAPFASDANFLFKQLRFSFFASFFKFYILGSKGGLVQCADRGNLDGVDRGEHRGDHRGDPTTVDLPVRNELTDELLMSLKEASIKGDDSLPFRTLETGRGAFISPICMAITISSLAICTCLSSVLPCV